MTSASFQLKKSEKEEQMKLKVEIKGNKTNNTKNLRK